MLAFAAQRIPGTSNERKHTRNSHARLTNESKLTVIFFYFPFFRLIVLRMTIASAWAAIAVSLMQSAIVNFNFKFRTVIRIFFLNSREIFPTTDTDATITVTEPKDALQFS
jgi:hypothetical protein